MILDGPAYIAVITDTKLWRVTSAHALGIEGPSFGVLQRRYRFPLTHGSYSTIKV